MSKKKKYTIEVILIVFSIFCALTIGQSLDEHYHLIQGKITLDYLLSLGAINDYINYREFYSTLYWSLQYFITEIFPLKYETEVAHLFNLVFSMGAIYGIGKVGKELFNKKVGEIVFLILFLYPAFFGHMAINNKDIILAFSHVWIVYLILRYLKIQHIRKKTNKYILYLALLSSISTGIQLTFFGSLIPIILFTLFEIFIVKIIIDKNFSRKLFFFDLFKYLILFYFILLLFWIDVHQNIIIGPFIIISEWISSNFITGWPYNLIDGKYYLSSEVPKTFLLINLLFKSPEYILLSYVIFLILVITSRNFFQEKFEFFNYKLSLLICVLIFPNLILYIVPFPVYDGIRLFIWILPYYCLIPALTFYYLIKNSTFIKSKITLFILLFAFVYYLINFLTITPYQYTYLNLLNGKSETRYKKFENDYWATSIKELVKNVDFKTDKTIKISTCGLEKSSPKMYLEKRTDIDYKFVSTDEADFIIMTNRVSRFHGIQNCFDIFKGDNISQVSRNGLILSVIRKIKL